MSGVDWYFVGTDGSQNGPVQLDDVKAAFKAKKVAGTCLVWNENMTDWVAFSTVPELKGLLAPAPVAPKKPPTLPGAAAAAKAPAAAAPKPAAAPAAAAPKPTVSAATIQKAASPAPAPAAAAAAAPAKAGDAKKFSAPKKATNTVAPAAVPTNAPAGLAAVMAAAKKPTTVVAPGKMPDKPKAVVAAAPAAAAAPKDVPAKAPTPEPAAAGPKKFAVPSKGAAAAAPAAAAAAKPAEVKTAAPAAVVKRVIPSPAATPPPSSDDGGDSAPAAASKPIARVPSSGNTSESTYKAPTVQRGAPVAVKKNTVRVDAGDKPTFLKAARCTGRGKGKPAAKQEAKKPVKAIGKDNVMEVEVDWQELKTPEGVPYYHNKKTNVTSWDKPDVLKTGDELDKAGEWVWMPSDVEYLAFVPARKIDVAYDGRIQCETDDGKMHYLPKGTQLEPLKWSSLRRLQRDLVMLDVMNQPLILHNLRERFKSNEIYTNVGTILISVNPYKRLPLYTPTIISEYRNRGNRALAPHVFTISDDSYNNLIENGQGQSIVISGESGAGKTECTKQCLQYLAEIAGSSNNVEQKILMANPILEAFGNAKTMRNNNSSRFGKYVEVFFDDRASICGAKTLNYLLEKSRVVTQTGDERNYHVFYQLCQGLPAKEKQKFKLKDAMSYSYLNQSGNITVDDVDDAAEFADMAAAFTTIGFSAAEVNAVFQTTIGVLHLGNVSFKSSGEKKCDVDNKTALADAAALFEVTTDDLVKAISNRTVRVKGQQDINVSLSKAEAESMRNALAKFVYAKLFDWLVVKINDSIGVGKAKKTRSIGILDIFGFEIFQVNYFEQLCINYCNEKLQQFFNAHTFKLEETVYRQEKIDFKSVNYIDNQPVLDFIEKKPEGILPSIDEELKMPKGTDQTWLEKLHKRAKGNPCYQMLIKTPEKFVVRHYAGDVTYESEGFLVKNLDKMSEDLFELLAATKFQFLQQLFESDRAEAASNRKETLGAKFAKQLNDLMATLNSTEPHYIRCVKPNKTKAPMDFNAGMVLQQLQYSGVFEAVQIRKSGFPFRYTHGDFRKRYKCILGAGAKPRNWPNDQAACMDLIKEMKQDTKQVQMGVTKVLYRAEQHQNMELIRNLAVEATCIFLQSHVRAWCVRRLATRLWRLRPVLQDAMAARTLPAVEEALKKCDGIKFEMLEITQIKRLKHVLLEEKRLTALLETLLKQDPEAVFEELSKAVASCDEIKFMAPLAEKARKTLTEITDRKQARAWLSEGVEEADMEKLTWAIAKAKEYNLPGVAQQLKAATDMVERIKKENVILEKLRKTTSAGGYLKEGDSIDFKALEPVVAEAKKFELKTAEGKKLGRLGALLLDLRKKLSAALGSKDKDKWKAVETVLLASHEEDKDNGEVVQAREEVSHQAAIDDVCDKLEAAVTALDQDQLTHYLDQASKLAINEEDYPVVPIARQYLERIVECRQIMAKAMEVVEQTQLEYAVEYAESFNYDTAEVQACRVLRDKVIQLNVETEYALKMLEEEPMKDILKRADAIKMTTDGIEKLRTLIFNTSEEKFVQLQLKATVALGDAARRIRVTIRLKDLFFKKSAAMFVLDNYPKLRSPAGWADLKFISFNRELLAAGCRKHTKEPIHNALTELDSPSDKIAQNMFKNVMGFMGDRAYPDPIHLVQEILKLCLEPVNAWLRPEIYCQIIKQVTSNPSQESLQKGWQLMAICLETFPPGELENYLEMWLRTNAKPPERYIRLLHGTVYGGARAAVPSTGDIQTIINGGTLSKINWEEKTDYKAPVANIPGRKAGAAPAAADYSAPPAAAAAARPSVPAKGPAINRGKPAPSVAGGVPPPPADDAPPGPPADAPPGPPSDAPPGPPPDDIPPAPAEAAPAVPPKKAGHKRRDSKPPPVKPKKVSLWATAQDPDTGDTYYYHQETGEVTWDKPADFDG